MVANAKEIGQRIRKLRLDRGLTQQQLADDTHMTLSAIGKIEMGIRVPSVDTLLIMADYFSVTTDYILLGRNCQTFRSL